jgi:hypothetical protein
MWIDIADIVRDGDFSTTTLIDHYLFGITHLADLISSPERGKRNFWPG